jgi:hypothetical protein
MVQNKSRSVRYSATARMTLLIFALVVLTASQVSVAGVVPSQSGGQLILTIGTGGDDLRGGNDNLDVFLVLRDGKMLRFDNVNRSRAWGNNSSQEVRLPLPAGLSFNDLIALRLETMATGGIGGDNWNLDFLQVQAQIGGETRTLVSHRGAPFFRFTGDQRALQVLLPAASGLSEVRVAPVNTEFRPQTHGFAFANQFKIPLQMFDITWAGLCGGMAYTALDYYFNRLPVPTQRYMPSPTHPMHRYLFQRQLQSLEANKDKWLELAVNPGGARNREFFNWGLQVGSGRLGELRRQIDAGRPVVIGLWECGGDCGCRECVKSHQVVAIGYDLGRYYGDLSRYPQDVRIFVYDPNYPGQIKTLRADVHNAYYYYETPDGKQDPKNRWRAYFVDLRYRAQRPSIPSAPAPRNEVWAIFKTGGDDLRGGNDNVHLVLLLRDGRQIRFENVNERQRWIDHSVNHVARALPDDLRSGDVVAVRIETTFGGGLGGDNWNLDWLIVNVRYGVNADWQPVFFGEGKEGKPLFRFTGDQRAREFRR